MKYNLLEILRKCFRALIFPTLTAMVYQNLIDSKLGYEQASHQVSWKSVIKFLSNLDVKYSSTIENSLHGWNDK